MLDAYQKHITERQAIGVVPKPLSAKQVAELVELLKGEPNDNSDFLIDLLVNRIPPGVDEAAYVKAGFLADVAKGNVKTKLVSRERATELLGTMQGGYNITPLVDLLDDSKLSVIAGDALAQSLLVFDAFYDVEEKMKAGNTEAKRVMQSWADATWFQDRPKLAEKISLTVFKVTGETNTDDLSPAQDAWSRPDIPLHALAMLKMPRNGIKPDEPGKTGPIKSLETLEQKGFPLVYVGDVVGTGSSRKSATNSVLWFMGEDIPFVPNKRTGGFCFGNKIAPIFFNTMEDAGALPIEMPVDQMEMGDVVDLYPYEGKVCRHGTDEVISEFTLKTDVLLDEIRAGGRISLIIGRALTDRARQAMKLPTSDVFTRPCDVADTGKGYTLAQKMVGKACGVAGVRPGQYCEPSMTTVGSQDTTGPMTRDELKDLACLGFSADLVMQSFCHTAAYPKPVDVDTHHNLPDFIMNRGGVSLRPGDGVIHSWLNRMLLPDTVGTGGDSHTRFPLGISFPAGSGLVAFGAATGVMPLDMPESILVRFTGKLQPGITLRDLVHAIPYYAIQKGFLTVSKQGKKNIFSGKVLEIEGLEDLKVEQAFELSDASAERSASGCTIKLNQEPVIEYITSNIVMLKWMIAEGYGDRRTIERRVASMQEWLDNPELMSADPDCEYAEVIEINMNEIKEPILCVPNDPDDARLLSEVQGDSVDEVFVGSCMTNIGHFRATGNLLDEYQGQLNTRLWVVPPTKMDQDQLIAEGYYGIFGRVGARTEIPGCSLCMGNQARVADGATVVSTSTRNFPNRMGAGANVYLASAEVSAVAAIKGCLPTVDEYMAYAQKLDTMREETYKYLNFNEIESYTQRSEEVIIKQAL